MLVSRGIINDDLELRERMTLQALTDGWATTDTYDEIADMRNVMTLAAAHKDDHSALAICDAVRVVMANMRDRYTRTGRIGASGDELRVLRVFVETYRDFWMRQPTELYVQACDDLRIALATPAPTPSQPSPTTAEATA
jgi:hypothetical protein